MSPIAIYVIGLILLTMVVFSFYYACERYRMAEELNPEWLTLEEVRKLIEDANRTKAKLDNEISQLSAHIIEGKRIIEEAKIAKKWLEDNKDTINKLQVEINATQDVLKGVTDELKKLKEEKKEVEVQIQALLMKTQDLESDISTLTSEISYLSERRERLKCEIAEMEGEFKRKQKEKATVDAELVAVKLELKMEKENLDEIKKEVDGLRERKQKMVEQIEDLEKQKADIERVCAELQIRKEGLEKEISSVECKLEEKKAVLQNVENRLWDKGHELERVEQELRSKQEKLDDVKERINDVENAVSALTGTRNDLETQIAGLEARLRGLAPVIEAEKSRWQDLDDHTNVPNINIKDKEKYEESEWLERFKGNLRDCGISFHDRMIHAFHTGLKTADISPLVVLAGISGTGKSLLPELYAHAIGMNFLQVAVQPRWDSPQDLLGFYNYMEGRFKATELSRLLWQSDRHNNKVGWKNHPAMNLVLLDEMNLARVEYYFSDLLSKLETGRGKDASVDENRKPAELIIDCGFAQNVEASRRLYVDNNTLFVGTMNEDETTQTLSDKVLDRANVLRFGKPANLDAKPDKKKFVKLYSKSMMEFADWKKTLKDSSSDGKLRATLDSLNSILSKIERPFGFRVDQAIRSYVANYPVSGRYQDALSDQVEMKILSKLSGLDKNDDRVSNALNEMLDILEKDVRDEQLIQAFIEAKDDGSGAFFQWRGVGR